VAHTLLGHQRRHCFFSKPPCRPYPGRLGGALLATAPVMALPLARLEGDRPVGPGWLVCPAGPRAGRQFGGAGRPGCWRLTRAGPGHRPIGRRSLSSRPQRERDQRCGDLLSWKARSAIDPKACAKAGSLVEGILAGPARIQLLFGLEPAPGAGRRCLKASASCGPAVAGGGAQEAEGWPFQLQEIVAAERPDLSISQPLLVVFISASIP